MNNIFTIATPNMNWTNIMKRLWIALLFSAILPTLALAQQLGYGVQFGLSASSLGSPTGTMASYSAGDSITLSCIQPSIGGSNTYVSFLTSPVVKVTTVSSGAVTAAIVTTPGQTNGILSNIAVQCSQASTTGSGTGYNVTAQLGPVPTPVPYLSAVANLPTLSTCGTSPSATAGSNSNAGQVTMGTATPTACTITFAAPYPNYAYCTIAPASSGGAAISGGYYISAQSKSAFTYTIGTGTSSLVFNYTCSGN